MTMGLAALCTGLVLGVCQTAPGVSTGDLSGALESQVLLVSGSQVTSIQDTRSLIAADLAGISVGPLRDPSWGHSYALNDFDQLLGAESFGPQLTSDHLHIDWVKNLLQVGGTKASRSFSSLDTDRFWLSGFLSDYVNTFDAILPNSGSDAIPDWSLGDGAAASLLGVQHNAIELEFDFPEYGLTYQFAQLGGDEVLGASLPEIITTSPGYNCSISPRDRVELASELQGVVEEVFVRPGQKVAEGDKLLRLDTDIAEAELAVQSGKAQIDSLVRLAESRRDEAAQALDIKRKGYRRNVVSLLEFERAEGDVSVATGSVEVETETREIAQIRADKARVNLEKSTIYSPVSGIVGEEIISPGEATSEDPLLTITVVQPLRVSAIVPQSRLSEFSSASRYEVVVGVDQPRRYELIRDYISPRVDQASNTVLAYFDLESVEVIPGQRCRVHQAQNN